MTASGAPPSTAIEDLVPACTREPERWTTDQPDSEAITLCRACPRRFRCAYDAWHTPRASGLWAGVLIPEEPGRPRDFAMRRVRDLAEHGGYAVRPRRQGRKKSTSHRCAS